MTLVRRSRIAMASRFEVVLLGNDSEHLEAVASAALEEVSRLDRLLSCHDPAAELSRVNRGAASRPVIVDVELFAVLQQCREWNDRTRGAFDPCVSSGRFAVDVQLDHSCRSVAFVNPPTRLDLGGFGKGYAIDRAAEIVASFGVRSFLIHGGTSSTIARGTGPDGLPWRVALRDPFDDPRDMVERIELSNTALSCSAVFSIGQEEKSDLVDPRTGQTLNGPDSCAVIAPTAVEAEVWSTALLIPGHDLITPSHELRVARFVRTNGSTGVEWWTPVGEALA